MVWISTNNLALHISRQVSVATQREAAIDTLNHPHVKSLKSHVKHLNRLHVKSLESHVRTLNHPHVKSLESHVKTLNHPHVKCKLIL